MTGISALPLAREEGGGEQHQKFRGTSRILGPGWLHLPTLTIGLLGVQIFWSVEMSYASPYLLSLGLSKSKMAIVFIAGPVSGLVMQPLIGVLADNCTSRFGRRRPYMMIGTLICVFAMLLLGFTRWFASIFTGWDNDSNDLLTIWLAVFAIYFIDFSINAVMAVDRALLVDVLPSSSQPQGNAWAARMLAVGAVIGFFFGNVNLTETLSFLGNTQLEILSVIACLLLLGGHLAMVILIKERVLLSSTDASGKSNRKSFVQEIKYIWRNILTLPRVIRQICFIQFFAWLGWFPLLFYSTLYVGDLHKRTSPVPFTEEARLALDTEATRLGSRALFWSAIISLTGNVILPAFIKEAAVNDVQKPHLRFGYGSRDKWWKKFTQVPNWMKIRMATLWALSHFVFASCMFATLFTESVGGASFLIAFTGFSWSVTQWAPFSLLGTAILTERSDDDDTSIRLADTRTPRRVNSSDLNVIEDDERVVFLPGEASDSEDENDDDKEDVEEERRRMEERRRVLGNSAAQLSRVEIDAGEISPGLNGNGVVRENGGLSAKAGIILGIHNIFIVIPQFLITGLSSVIFAIFDPEQTRAIPYHGAPVHAPPAHNGSIADINAKTNVLLANVTEPAMRIAREVTVAMLNKRQAEEDGTAGVYEGSNSVVYIFRFGGIAAAIAAVLSWKLAKELKRRGSFGDFFGF